MSKFTFQESDYVYDIETFPNFFHTTIKHALTGQYWRFEISEWKDESVALLNTLMTLSNMKARMIGFNSLSYDYPMLHMFIQLRGVVTNAMIYQKSKDLISGGFGNNNTIWPDNRFIEQIDLMLIHHFDNHAKHTSLKMLEFNMRSESVQELPYPFDTNLTREQANNIITYNDKDVDETEDFFGYSLAAIDLRTKLTKKYNRDFMNHNDTKIGKDYFKMMLTEASIPVKVNGKTNQTIRESITVNDALLPYVKFERPEFNNLLTYFKNAVIDKKDIKGNLNLVKAIEVSETIDGFKFDLGTGGIHGSIQDTIVSTSATHKLFDVDVASYYPNLAIQNKMYPEHLTEKFCEIFLDVYNQRKGFLKSTPENGMLKLALNGVYGDSNQPYSFFYDPKFTLKVTINGQLLLCMLAEQIMKIPGLTMVQINTDGMTYLCPNESIEHTRAIQRWWEGITNLELEEVEYRKMYVCNVNNYIAEKMDGKLKRIGKYCHERAAENPATREIAWHKDFSALVIPKAAEAALVRGVNIEQFIRSHTDIHDFMLRTKVPKSSYLLLDKPVMWGDDVVCRQTHRLQNISRYYPSLKGGIMKKVMPPTDKQKIAWETGDHYIHKKTKEYKVMTQGKKPPSGMYFPVTPEQKIIERADNVTKIEAHYLVEDCSDMKDFKREDLNYDYYIKETHKIVDPLFSNSL